MDPAAGSGLGSSGREDPGLGSARGARARPERRCVRTAGLAAAVRGRSARAESGSVPYRALGTSTRPRPPPPPPPGPVSASPLYFSSIRAQEPPPLPLPRGLLMSSRCRGTAGAGASLPHGSSPVGFSQAGPPLLSSAPVHKRKRAGTRPRAVSTASVPGRPHRQGRCQATSSGPATLTPGGVPNPAPAHRKTLVFPRPSLGSSHRGVTARIPAPISLSPRRG